MSSLGELAHHRIIPVVIIDDAERAADLAQALAAGGIHCAEITLRTPAALAAISAMASIPDFTVGVGTVLSRDQLRRSIDAGASFVVTPGFDPELVGSAVESGVAVLPGIATATEAMAALRAGIDVVKFFPADRLGGLDTIRALAAPLPQLRFVPSGGVTARSAVDYLGDSAVFAVSGSWMAPRALIDAGSFDEIERLSSATVAAIGAK